MRSIVGDKKKLDFFPLSFLFFIPSPDPPRLDQKPPPDHLRQRARRQPPRGLREGRRQAPRGRQGQPLRGDASGGHGGPTDCRREAAPDPRRLCVFFFFFFFFLGPLLLLVPPRRDLLPRGSCTLRLGGHEMGRRRRGREGAPRQAAPRLRRRPLCLRRRRRCAGSFFVPSSSRVDHLRPCRRLGRGSGGRRVLGDGQHRECG